jgi:hypothetical protein
MYSNMFGVVMRTKPLIHLLYVYLSMMEENTDMLIIYIILLNTFIKNSLLVTNVSLKV